jgi:hypothetical protein
LGGKGGARGREALVKKAKAFKKAKLAKYEIRTFFFKKFGFAKNLPCFFAFFKNYGSISPRIAIIVSTSRSLQFFELTLVENMVKKNRSCFPIAVLLTTLICSH